MSKTQCECPGQLYDWGCLYLLLLHLILHHHHPQLGRQCFIVMEKRCCLGAINFGQSLTCVFTLLLLLLFSCSVVSNSLWPYGLQARQAYLSFTICRSLLKLMSIELVMLSNHLIHCHPVLLPSVFPSVRVFPSESSLHLRWPKYWSFTFSISPSSYSGWFHLGLTGWISLQSKGLSRVFLNTKVQKHLWCSAFFMVQLSHPYITAGKTIALTMQTFVSKVMSLLFNIPSRFVIDFLDVDK